MTSSIIHYMSLWPASCFKFLLCLPTEKAMASHPVLLPGKSHGWRSLEGCSPWGRWGSDTTERLHFHFSLWCIGEGNGNPLQCSCLENPRDGGAWWAAVYGIAQSQTQLKQLSSSSSKTYLLLWHKNDDMINLLLSILWGLALQECKRSISKVNWMMKLHTPELHRAHHEILM